MLTIRFLRVGKKNQPSFKIVVTDKRKPPKGGRFVEEVGFYNPLTKQRALKGERIKYWLSVGASPSDTVYNLLIMEKIISGEGDKPLKKRPVHKIIQKEGGKADVQLNIQKTEKEKEVVGEEKKEENIVAAQEQKTE